jgi:hypothetical protein
MRTARGHKQVLLRHFLEAFPLRGHGTYHCRFRVPDHVSGYCWMDLSDPNSPLPTFEDAIWAKLLRLDALPHLPRASRMCHKPVVTTREARGLRVSGAGPVPGSSVTPNYGDPPPRGGAAGRGGADLSSAPAASRPARGRSVPREQGTTEQHSKGIPSRTKSATPPHHDRPELKVAAAGADLLNFDPSPQNATAGTRASWKIDPSVAQPNGLAHSAGPTPASHTGHWGGAVAQPQKPADFLGAGGNLDARSTSSTPTGGLSPLAGHKMAGKSPYVQQKMQERSAKVEEETRKAIQFKKDMDAAAVQEQEDFDSAKSKHGARLTQWAEDHGQKRNIRTLLSTMHTVLWEGCRWKEMSMADVIPPNKVKLAYRKAMLVVHPDKCTDIGPEERFMARRVFEALNEAYSTFVSQEMAG